MGFWDWFWLAIEVFLIVAYLQVLFFIFRDLFTDGGTSGLLKALWVFVLMVVPVLAALLYLIVRGRGMTQRQNAAMVRAAYGAASTERTTAAQQIAVAKQLLDAGAITDSEFRRLKAASLALADQPAS